MTTQQEFLQQHAPDGVLSPEAAAQFLELVQGDTGTPVVTETGSEPNAATAGGTDTSNAAPDTNATTTQEPKTEPTQQASSAEIDPATAVVLAKDGVHTIPYQKLIDAREGEKHWRTQAETALTKLNALEAEAQQRATAGAAPTAADTNVATAAAAVESGVDPAIFGDFSEAAIAKGIHTMQQQATTTLRAELRSELKAELLAEVKAELAPLQQRHAQTAAEQHAAAIYGRHPDADSLVESKELAAWIASQPSFARAGYQAVMEKGTAAEVNEFLDAFKKATGVTTAATTEPTGDVKAAAKAAVASAQAAPPVSLSDIPGGRPGAQTLDEVMANKSGPELIEAMQSMTPAQIEAYLNRQM